jgi:hypothetical protein
LIHRLWVTGGPLGMTLWLGGMAAWRWIDAGLD